MRNQLLGFFIPALLAATAGGCSTDDPATDFETVALSMEGIYRLDAHTANTAACAPGGESLLGNGNDGFVVVKNEPFFGFSNLSLMSCASPSDCRAKLAALSGGEGVNIDFSFAVQEIDGDGALVGRGANTGFNEDGMCVDGSITATTVTLAGQTLAIAQRITIADAYPQDDGFCTTDLAKEAAAGNSCSEMIQLSGTFVESL